MPKKVVFHTKYLNEIVQGDCLELMKELPNDCIDLVVTSPPYDNLREYKGYSFDFENIAKELYRVTKNGGVVVWVVGDATVKGSETGTSFKQALYFKEIGFKLHDTMIWEKTNPMPITEPRYQASFEYMFVFSKGKPNTVNLIQVPKSEKTLYRQQFKMKTTNRGKDGEFKKPSLYKGNDRGYTTKKRNIWSYAVGFNAGNDKYAREHPAIFPEQLAQDHIISWSNPGDIVLDIFGGSGTTAKMAKINKRNFINFEISEEYCEIANKRVSEIS